MSLSFCLMAYLTLIVTPADEHLLVPVIDGEFRKIAGNPELGPYQTSHQEPVDFGIWQAADGSWQLWSCIRSTKCGGKTRLFYRWEGQKLTDPDWRPMGIAMEADSALGETPGGMQAPHVVKQGDRYVMAYGDWERICLATSRDGKTFERQLNDNGKVGIFDEGPGNNTRDPMLMYSQGTWYCYYTAHPNGRGYDYVRTSNDLEHWGHSAVVAYGGYTDNGPYSRECPQVVEPAPGVYHLFCTQIYKPGPQSTVYTSRNPLYFGIDDDRGFVCTLPVAAPEIVRDGDQWYLACLMPELDGIRIARLAWKKVPANGIPVFDFRSEDVRQQWKLTEGEFPMMFTRSQRSDFVAPMGYFISTCETPDGRYDDKPTGTIESPTFTLDGSLYALYVSGGNRPETEYVALVDADSGRELCRHTGRNTNRFSRLIVNWSQWKGRKVRLRIVDQYRQGWGHINFGGLYNCDYSTIAP